MKFRTLGLAALAAAIGLVSCNKEPATPEGGAPKSVIIKLANVAPSTRSADDGYVNRIEEGDKVTLKTYQVFFTDGTTLYRAKTSNNDVMESQFVTVTEDTDLTQPTNYHFLSPSVNKVIVVGNMEQIPNDVTTVAGLKEKMKLEIKDQQTVTNLALYAEALLTNPTTGHTSFGHETVVYTANLTLMPTIARLEVENFECTFTGIYEELSLTKLALNNYYRYYNPMEEAGKKLTNDDPTHNITVETASVWDWVSGLEEAYAANEWRKFSYDAPAETLKPATAATATAPVVVTSAINRYYHIFAVDASNTLPQLVLRCEGKDNGVPTPLYLSTKNFKFAETDGNHQHDAGPITEFKAGNIYRMDFAFSDADLKHPDKCVDITVTQSTWVVHLVTPEF